MKIKFNRSEISSISSIQTFNIKKAKNIQQNKIVAVPAEEIAIYIYNVAESGNEMAAVQIDEWCRFCKPNNIKEEYVLSWIKKAADELFE